MPFVGIVQPDDRRWNSFTMCLESILKIRPALEALLEDNDPQLAPLIPSGCQLDALQELLHPLKLIKTTSDTLQADTRPTMHLVLRKKRLNKRRTLPRKFSFDWNMIDDLTETSAHFSC